MDSFANARLGIQMATQGRRQEALTYLRLAVQTEPPNAEVWLWLANVTPIREEYQHCIQQALAIAPEHTIARQMQHLLQSDTASSTSTNGVMKPMHHDSTRGIAVDDNLVRAMQRQKRTRGRRRFLLSALLFFGLLIVAAVVGLLFQETFSEHDNADSTGNSSTLTLAILPANRELSVSFSMTVPESWLIADTLSPQWQTAKEQLAQNDPIRLLWSNFETDPNGIMINPANDDLEPALSIVETDVSLINATENIPLQLRLVRLGAIYASMDDSSCNGMQQLESTQENIIDRGTDDAPQIVVETGVVMQDSGECLFFVHYLNQTNREEGVLDTHTYALYVPAGPQSLAEWRLITVGEGIALYETAITTLLNTLQLQS